MVPRIKSFVILDPEQSFNRMTTAAFIHNQGTAIPISKIVIFIIFYHYYGLCMRFFIMSLSHVYPYRTNGAIYIISICITFIFTLLCISHNSISLSSCLPLHLNLSLKERALSLVQKRNTLI